MSSLIPTERIERRILLLRGQKVLLDVHLAELDEVEVRTLNQAVRRNLERFPQDFMFQLSWEEAREILRSQFVILGGGVPSEGGSDRRFPRSQSVILKSGKNLKYRPLAFTEQGVAMLSSVLRSQRAILVNIAIMRSFVQLRQMLASHAELARKLAALEAKYDSRFKIVFEAIRELMSRDKVVRRREIGFHTAMPGREKKRLVKPSV
jgi:hypothetical protein